MTNEKHQRFAEWKAAKRALAVARREVIAAKLALSIAKIALNDAIDAETMPLRKAS